MSKMDPSVGIKKKPQSCKSMFCNSFKYDLLKDAIALPVSIRQIPLDNSVMDLAVFIQWMDSDLST